MEFGGHVTTIARGSTPDRSELRVERAIYDRRNIDIGVNERSPYGIEGESMLDATDRAIIAHLQSNARMSNRALADAVSIAPSTCSERLNKLRDAGVFDGFHAEVNPEVLGLDIEALISIRLRRHGAPEVEKFTKSTDGMPEVKQIFHTSGGNDFLCHVIVRDAKRLRELVVNGFTTLPEVAHVETSLVFEHRSKPVLIEPV
jgi:DNA-binding Lrp family transcriptional regulator